MKTVKSFILPIILATLFFTSCSDYDNGFTENQIRYEKAFYDVFGEIDPNQDWNLVKQLAAEQGKNTRNSRPDISDNPQNDKTVYQPEGYSDNQKEIVRLFFQNNKYLKGISYPYDEFFAQQIYTGHTKVGTEYGSASDCMEYYKAADNNWYDAAVMNTLTVCHDGNKFHIDNFNNGKYGRGNATGMYVQDADATLFGYTNSANSFITGHYVIIDGETIDAWAKGEGAKILESQGIDFESVASSISQTPDGNNGEKGEQKIIKRYFLGFDFVLYEDERAYSGEYFEYNGDKYPYLSSNMNQYCGDVKTYNDANKPQGDAIGEMLKAGYLPVNDKTWVKLGTCADGYYSDWIISITSGKHGVSTETETVFESGLLICEDLGSQDFDFNDIVLKLEHIRKTIIKDGSEPDFYDRFVITAMAAGGTLPSYVYYKPLRLDSKDRKEEIPNASDSLWTWLDYTHPDKDMTNGIHHMVGSVENNLVPLNVGDEFIDGQDEGYQWSMDINDAIKFIETSPDEEIRQYVNNYVSYVFDFARIRIYVGGTKEEYEKGKPGVTYIEPINHGIEDDGGSSYKAETAAPQMILVPENFEWPTECTPIADAYPQFREWVRIWTQRRWFENKRSDSDVTSRRVSGGGNNSGDDAEVSGFTQYATQGIIPASFFQKLQNKITITIKASSTDYCQPFFYYIKGIYDWGTDKEDLTGWEWMAAGSEKTIIINKEKLTDDVIQLIKKYGLGIGGNNLQCVEYMDVQIE